MSFIQNEYWGLIDNPLVVSPFSSGKEDGGIAPPPPETFYVITYQGDLVVTNTGDNVITAY